MIELGSVISTQLSPCDRSLDLNATFWQQWQQYRDYLYRCCIKWMGGDAIDAEDALSQAMLKAWEKVREGAVVIKNFKTWLTQLTYNLCVDIYRQKNRTAVEVEDVDAIAPSGEWASQEETPILAASRQEIELFLHHAIDRLPPLLRQTFILYFEKELSYREIGEELNISYPNVRKRISQARGILRQQLNEFEGTEQSTFPPSPSPLFQEKKSIASPKKGSCEELISVPKVSQADSMTESREFEEIPIFTPAEPQEAALLLETIEPVLLQEPVERDTEESEATSCHPLNQQKKSIPPIFLTKKSIAPLKKWEWEELIPQKNVRKTEEFKVFYLINTRGISSVFCLPSEKKLPIPSQGLVGDKDERLLGKLQNIHNFIATGVAQGLCPHFYEVAKLFHTHFWKDIQSHCNKSYSRIKGDRCQIPAIGKLNKLHPLAQQILELFELCWQVWMDSGGCQFFLSKK